MPVLRLKRLMDRFDPGLRPLGRQSQVYRQRHGCADLQTTSVILSTSSCALLAVCVYFFFEEITDFPPYTFWSLVSDPVSHSLHSFLFFFLLSGISPGLVRRLCELFTWQLLQHWKVSEYLYLSYGKFFFKEIKNQNKFGLVDSRLASCTHL